MESITPEAREQLTKLGFLLVEHKTPEFNEVDQAQPIWAYGRYRFPPAANFLRENPTKYRYAVWTDVRDVVFQSDPSVWLEKNLGSAHMAIAGLGHKIKDCPYNDPWLYAASPNDYEKVREEEALALGTFGGEAGIMRKMFEDIYWGCKMANHPAATDQGMFNALARRPQYRDIVRIPGPLESFSAQWFPAKNNDQIVYPGYAFPVFDKPSGLVLTQTCVPYSIVHLYDRDPAWVQIMRQKYGRN